MRSTITEPDRPRPYASPMVIRVGGLVIRVDVPGNELTEEVVETLRSLLDWLDSRRPESEGGRDAV